MDAADQWDARKMFDLYLHDYLVKKKLHHTAAIFREEANVCSKPVAIDSIDGFLHEWWTLFYDVFASRQLQHREGKEKSSDQDKQINEVQNICTTVPQFAIDYQEDSGPFPFFPEYMRLAQPVPFIVPMPSSQPQQNSNQAQQLAVTQNRIGNDTPGPNCMSINCLGVQRGIFPLSRFCDAGVNERVNPFPPNVWLLNSPGLVPNLTQQFPRLMEQSQQNLSGQSTRFTYGNMTPTFPRRSADFQRQKLILPKSNLSGKEAQMMVQMKQTEEHQDQNYQIQREQLTHNSRKKRRLVYSVAGENTLGHANAEVEDPVDEVESFLSSYDDNEGDEGIPLGTLKHRSTASSKTNHTGFTFQEIGCLHSSKSKVLCCHFSSNGRLLASAGHEKKVFILNMDSYDVTNSLEGHSLLITDVRFRPNSTILATSSFDRTLQIWDAAKPSKSLFKLHGHAEQVMALDFHPRKVDLLCSCDSNDEIRLWNVNRGACVQISKGATKQVKFQPQTGKLLATATGNTINVVDTENYSSSQFNLKGHVKEVLCLSWDTSGKYLASVSEDSARVWSLVSGGSCLNELQSNGNKFRSCTFHPGYSLLLIIGCYQSLELWNPIEGSKTWSVAAHNGLIAALDDSLENEMIASASHDRCVKIWK